MSNRRVCSWCKTPYRLDCQYCPIHLDSLKVQGDVIRDLKHKLLGFDELDLEHYRLKRQHEDMYYNQKQAFEKLEDVYNNQKIELINILKKNRD